VPLKSQGLNSITFKQLREQLKTVPELQGLEITDDLISQAVEELQNVTAEADPSDPGSMVLKFENTSDAPGSKFQAQKGAQKVDQAAVRQATKDLGAPDGF
jgi:hypothetical protein